MRYDEYEGNWSPDGDDASDPALPIPPAPRSPNAPDDPGIPGYPGIPETADDDGDGDDTTEYWTPPGGQAWSPAFGNAAVGLDALSSLSGMSRVRGASRPFSRPLTQLFQPLQPYASVDSLDSISGSAVPTPRQRQRQALRGWITFAVFTLLLCGMLGGMLGLINPGTRNDVAHYTPGLAYQTPTPASNSDAANPTAIPSPTPHASPTPTPPTQQRPTPTPTLRPGVTPSPTSIVTATATAQPTATSTPPPTATGTTPPTATAQPTATTQPTATATTQPTATSTAQPTPTQTSTPAPTATATDTPPPTSTATPSATPPGSTPTPTITPTITPGTATVRLTAASKSYSTKPAMTACAGGGCTLSDQVITSSHAESDTWQSTWVGQTQLGGYININMISGRYLFFNGWVEPYGNGWYCPRSYVNINFVQGATVHCFFSVSSPNYLAPGTLSGNCILGYRCSQLANVGWSSQAFRGNNGYWLETQAECNSAINDTENRGRTWSHEYVNNHVESGGTLGDGPHTTFSSVGCNPGPGSNQQWFTASSVANAFGLAYYPADAQSVARQRLIANTLPNGYAWTFQSTCSPSTSSVNGDTLNLSCGENGVAAYDWTNARQNTLAGQLAGQTVNAATSACNATYGVAAGSCTISVQNGSILPSNPAQITIVVTTPTSASSANGPPDATAASPGALLLPISAMTNPLTDPPPLALFGSLALALITLAWTRRRFRR